MPSLCTDNGGYVETWISSTAANTANTWCWTTTAAATACTTNIVWPTTWIEVDNNAWSWVDPVPLLETEAERQAREVVDQQQRVEREARRTVKVQADERAEQLFLRLLKDEQRAEHERDGQVTLRAPSGRRYRVRTRTSRHHNIHELDAQDRHMATLCCAPEGDIPHFDAILGQIVALQFDEHAFRQAANITQHRQAERAA